MKILILCKSIKCDLSNQWKGILHRITIWNQNFSQHIPEESALKLGLFFSDFEDYSKSAQGMILFFLVTCSYTPIQLKNTEKPTVIWLFTQNCFKSTVPILTSFFFKNKEYSFIRGIYICNPICSLFPTFFLTTDGLHIQLHFKLKFCCSWRVCHYVKVLTIGSTENKKSWIYIYFICVWVGRGTDRQFHLGILVGAVKPN